jgi:glycosyltransferase involved in cell wall biosynthesis
MSQDEGLKISIITVCYNSEKTIGRAIESVLMQKYKNYEHLIIDGSSKDSTVELARQFNSPNLRIYSEPDDGIYHAMNKGFASARGDVIAYLNSDDYYYNDNVLRLVANEFSRPDVDFVFGDILMLNRELEITRYWRTTNTSCSFLKFTQIPHPGLFVRKNALDELDGPFDQSYSISADLKQQLILINKNKRKGSRLMSPIACMSLGGASTQNISGYLKGWRESIRAYNEVFGGGGFLFTIGKVFSKISQLIVK